MSLYRHYKGSLYRVLYPLARHTETEEAFVVYRCEPDDGRVWLRPAAMFHETLPDGRPRFEPLAE
ncbi:MAG: DUF1653 domain-containing protein [Alphaproteobacteria bacterium]